MVDNFQQERDHKTNEWINKEENEWERERSLQDQSLLYLLCPS